jgi:ribonucleoside-diphosphate reductase alpha chain
MREVISQRRRSTNVKTKIGTFTMYVTFGEYVDGRLAEVFIDVAREGATIRAWMNAFAMSLSLGLQHGLTPFLIVRAFRGYEFEPKSLPGEEGSYKSMIDFIATYIYDHYLTSEEQKALEKNKNAFPL